MFKRKTRYLFVFLRAYIITSYNLIKYLIISLHFFLISLSIIHAPFRYQIDISQLCIHISIYFTLNVIKNIILPFKKKQHKNKNIIKING